MPTGIISAGFLEKVNEHKEQKHREAEEKEAKEREAKAKAQDGGGRTENAATIDDKKHYCPYCGHRLD
jgi:hypothetical protein